MLRVSSSSLSSHTWAERSSSFEGMGFFLPHAGSRFGGDAFELVEEGPFCWFYIADATGHGAEGAVFWAHFRVDFENLWEVLRQKEPSFGAFQEFAEKLNATLASYVVGLPKEKAQLCLTIGAFSMDGKLMFMPFGYGTHLLAQGKDVFLVARRFGLKLGWFSNTQRASSQMADSEFCYPSVKRIILMTDGGLGEDYRNPSVTLDFLDQINRESLHLPRSEIFSFLQQHLKVGDDDSAWLVLERQLHF